MGDHIGQRMGNYTLTRLLGRGGFAEVYLGEHRYLGSEAAIKVLNLQADQRMQELIAEEARTSARLDHPHIARVLEFGFEGATPYLVMPFAPGGTLRTRHPRGTILSFERIMFYTMQIAEALQYAHDEKVVHRDVKPENILIGQHNELLLGDFGIAVVAHETASLSEQAMMGTSVYMAPEQARGKARPASDQYALAVVVYEWICGTPPFTGTPVEVLLKHQLEQPSFMKRGGPMDDEPTDYISQVLMKSLDKDPHGRFPTVMAFARALEEISRDHKPGIGTAQVLYRKHASAVYALAWSPDGKRIASGSEDRTVQVWDAQTGERLFTYQGHADLVVAAEWSPDGRRIASSSGDRSMQIWDASTGTRYLTYHGHDPGGENPLEITALAWSPDGTRIASGGEDKTVQIWDTQTGQRLLTYRGHDIVNATKWSPDGAHIASASWDWTVQVWEARTGRQMLTYHRHTNGVTCLVWSPDGTHIASGAMDNTVQIWEARTGACVFVSHEHGTHITALAWVPDGRRIASAGADGVVRVWQAEQPVPW